MLPGEIKIAVLVSERVTSRRVSRHVNRTYRLIATGMLCFAFFPNAAENPGRINQQRRRFNLQSLLRRETPRGNGRVKYLSHMRRRSQRR